MNWASLFIRGLILSILVVLFTTTSAFAQKACLYVMDPEAEAMAVAMENWKKGESLKGVPPENQKGMYWGGLPGEKTEIAILAFHGLFNSPRSLLSLLKLFLSTKQNTMMSRLEGHFESDFSRMKYHIKWKEWLEQTDAEFLMARKLGKKVLLVGHSTGSLFATWLALRYPDDVAGLVLFSPAYGVNWMTQVLAWLSDKTGITPMKKDGQILYGHAGGQVVQAAAAYRRFVETQTKKNPNFVSDTLSKIPIWSGNTPYDLVIQKGRAQAFIDLVSEKNPNDMDREDYWTPLMKPVIHDNITTAANKSLPDILTRLERFINSILGKANSQTNSQPHETGRVD